MRDQQGKAQVNPEKLAIPWKEVLHRHREEGRRRVQATAGLGRGVIVDYPEIVWQDKVSTLRDIERWRQSCASAGTP